jgi:hypothetical protein
LGVPLLREGIEAMLSGDADAGKAILRDYINATMAIGTVALSSVPEPSTWAMMLFGVAGLGFAGFRAREPAVAAV